MWFIDSQVWAVSESYLVFFFSSRRRHTRLQGDLEFRRVLFRSRIDDAAGQRLHLRTRTIRRRQLGHLDRLRVMPDHATDERDICLDETVPQAVGPRAIRSEERRVGEEGRSRWTDSGEGEIDMGV